VADEKQNDPPWGRPLDPRDLEPGAPAQEPHPRSAQEPDAPAEDQGAPAPDQGAPAPDPGAPAQGPPQPQPPDGGREPGEAPGAIPVYGQGAAQTQEPEQARGSAGPAVTDEPEPRLRKNARPAGHQDDEIPANIVAQTREGEQPYQWHSGLERDHGSTDAVEFIDVKKSFGRNTILNGLNLGIPDNQISMVLGPSGTGKSVCIKHMVGLLYPDRGDVLVHGQSVPNMADDELFEMRKKFGVLFQDGALFGSMNVLDNVAFPLRQHTDKGEEEIDEICRRRLGEVGLQGALDKYPNELSGGMRKRAGFARALVLDPDIVVFDEPDSGLDPVRTALLCELIQEVHAENGGAYVMITHDIMSARRVADYIAVLWKGRIVESGPASELFNSPNQFVRQFLSGEARGPLGME
jgi:phospholipid/cholesterol/gamma-HCH transport system ATP-binding protein